VVMRPGEAPVGIPELIAFTPTSPAAVSRFPQPVWLLDRDRWCAVCGALPKTNGFRATKEPG
jgi:hypothetical protein